MTRQQKSKIQIVVICGLLLLSSFDNCDGAKSSSKSKSKSSGSSSSRKPASNPASYANPGSLSYSGISPNAPQPKRPSAPVQHQPAYAAQAPKPAYNQPQAPYPVNNAPNQQAANTRPVGWNVDNNQRQNSAPYPVNNQPKPNSPPYPTNNNQQFGNPPPPYSHQPNQGPPPAYGGGQSNFHDRPPAYNPQQQSGFNQHQQPAYQPHQPAYQPQPQPGYQQPPQIINNYHGVSPGIGGGMGGGGFGGGGYGGGYPQQSGGPGILKTAVVAGAAGLGGAALYNAFKNDDPKTTVIYVNNTQPAAAPAAAPAAEAAPAPAVAQPQYPQQQYPQQYPQQQYTQQPYDPNQQYNPNQQQYPNQQYDPNQQYNQNQPYNPALAPVPIPADGASSLPPSTPVETVNSPTQVAGVESIPTQPPVGTSSADASTGAPTVADSSVVPASEASTSGPITSSEVTTTTSTTILTNSSVPIAALSTRVGEAVEQRSASVTNQAAPNASESKTENTGSHLKYSFTVLSLALIYQVAIKSLL